MKTKLVAIVSVFISVLATGFLTAFFLRTEDPAPPPKIQRVCGVCDDYKSKKETIKERFRALKETRNSLDLQAKKEGILNPAPPPPGEHIDSSAPGRAGHIGTMIYWDKKRDLSYEELALQRLRLDLWKNAIDHAILERLEKLGEE